MRVLNAWVGGRAFAFNWPLSTVHCPLARNRRDEVLIRPDLNPVKY
jgi:hypothetical protein